jgi:hypothetical protein
MAPKAAVEDAALARMLLQHVLQPWVLLMIQACSRCCTRRHPADMIACHNFWAWCYPPASCTHLLPAATAPRRAMHILQLHMEDLHSLAAALLERETLTGEQITEALKASKQQKAQAAAAAASAAVQTATQEAQAAAAAPAAQEVPVVAMPMPTMAMSAQSPAIKAGGASSR